MALNWPAVTDDDADLLGLHERGPGTRHDRFAAGLADAAVCRNLTAAQDDAAKR
jgi:hypothetical protein